MTWDQTYAEELFGPRSGSIEIRNLRGVVTGRLGDAVIEAETLRAEAGVITAIGAAPADADVVVDAAGAVAIPGLCDHHAHLVFPDYSPRQHVLGWVESYLHGGVTFMMSACEVHQWGRPTDPVGVKALAITAQRTWDRYRPGGVKAYGGSVICEPGLTRDDLAEVRDAGVWLLKVGFGAFAHPTEAAPIVAWARELGFVVMCHTGGASIPGSAAITGPDLLVIDPHIAGHLNGGTTSISRDEALLVIHESEMDLQLVQAGNLKEALFIVETTRELGRWDRITIGTDTPTGTGVMPLGVLKTLCELSSLGAVPPTDAIAFASGNCARSIGKPQGILEVGRPADIVLLNEPLGCTKPGPLEAMAHGDIPSVCAVVIDGQIRALKSRNTVAPAREAHARGWITR
jgi:enamidase